MDSVTEVTRTGLFSRLGQSIMGIFIGLLILLVSFILLYWNEGRAVAASTALSQGQKQMVEAPAGNVDPGNDGKLVHLSAAAAAAQPAQDDTFGVVAPNLLVLQRRVEMYQWKESKSSHSSTGVGGTTTTTTTTTTYDYSKDWSEQPRNSGEFHVQAGHDNPPMTLRSASAVSDAAMLGPYKLDAGLLREAPSDTPVSPPGDAAGYTQDNGYLYKGVNGGSPGSPQVGDVRVRFTGLPAQTLSVVAEQSSGALTPFRSANGFVIALIRTGTVDGATLFAEKKQEEGRLTWILRGAGFVLMMIGFMLFMRPLSVLGSVLPFLGGLIEAGAFMFALALSVPLTLVTIALAWLAHRPVLGWGLIAAAVAVYFLLGARHRKAKTAMA
jgi:hypothetical protein